MFHLGRVDINNTINGGDALRLTIGKKLTLSFLGLALLVLLSGGVGIIILNKVAKSGDTVVKEKVPAQYSVMKAILSVEGIQKAIADYSLSSSNLVEKERGLESLLDELDMWIAMLEFGTSSEKFKTSKSYTVYKNLKLDIEVPQSTKELLKIVTEVKRESIDFRTSALALVKAHNEYLAYSYDAEGKIYDLPSYLLLLKQHLSDWYTSLESVVVSVTKFEKNTDPTQGPIGIWLNTYKLDDEGFNKLFKQLNKYHKKMVLTAVKINEQKEFEGKDKFLKRNRGNLARVNKYLGSIIKYIAPSFQKLHATKLEKSSHVTDSGKKIRSELEKLVKSAEKEMSLASQNSEAAKRNGIFLLVVLTICAVVIALVLGIYISRYLTRGITSLAKATKLIAQGELKSKVNITSKDELGDLANDTNAMTDNLRGIITKITNYSNQLTQSSSDLTGLAGSMSEGAQNMTQKSESVAAAAEEMSANMNSVTAASEEAVININTVSVATDEINSSINEIAKSSETGNHITQEAVESANSATKRVNELEEAAKEISKVTEVISEISEQTNLLALNATIEAARAGNAGKGFAVVASEIKQLAVQTAEATNDIKKRIGSIQNATDDTVGEIETVAKNIESIHEIVGTIASAVEEQSATTREISENMGQASSGLQKVSENVAQSTTVASETAKDIGEVNASSNEVLSNSDLVHSSSGELKKLAADLQELISQFKL
ncbi:MAG: HAMP domain-containing protein [Desulfobacteraceae bacterium]|nr:HAMP domain-containing protein [Desulfobacteraceae bacterium]